LLTITAGTVIGTPPLTAACRAGIRAAARGQYLTHDHVLDLGGVDPGLLQRSLDRETTEVGS
jgi:hypothetical protein